MRSQFINRPGVHSGLFRFVLFSLCVMLAAAAARPALAQTSINTPPTLDIIDPVTMPEDSPAYTVPLAGISAGSGDTGQTLTVTAKSGDPTIFPDPVVNYTSPDATGSLAITPLPNKFGAATVTVTVKDSGGTANGGVDTVTRTFLVNVTAVNDPPTIHAFPVFGVRGQPLAFSAQEFRDAYTDVENDPLAAVKFLSLPSTGTLALNGTPVAVGSAISASQLDGLVFLPAVGWYGTFDLSWTASDGAAYALQPATLTVVYAYKPLSIYLPFAMSQSRGWDTLFSESFEGDFPGGWQFYSSYFDGTYYNDVTSAVSWGKRTCRVASGAYSAWAVGGGSIYGNVGCQDGYTLNIETWMRYGPFNLSQARDALLTLKMWTDIEYEVDNLGWGVSLDGENFYGKGYTGDSGGWLDSVVDLKNVYTLGNVTGASQIWIGVWFVSGGTKSHFQEGAAVDNILLSTCTRVGDCPGTPMLSGVRPIPETLKVTPAYHSFRGPSQVAVQSLPHWPEVRQQQ